MEATSLHIPVDIQKQLIRFGWAPWSSVNIDEHLKKQAELGRPLPPIVARFLEQFSELTIRDKDGLRFNFHSSVDGPWLNQEFNDRLFAFLARVTGQSLYYIGIGYSSDALLFMDSEGRIYAYSDDYVWLVGTDLADSLRGILSGRPGPHDFYDPETGTITPFVP